MRPRVLAYDPDPRGRRLLRQGLAGFDLVLRSSPATCREEIRRARCQTLVIGLPVAPEDLADLLLATQASPDPPAVFLLGGGEGHAARFSKDLDGLRALARVLPAQTRANQITNLAVHLCEVRLDLTTPEPFQSLEEKVLGALGRLGLCALLAHADAESGQWLVTGPPSSSSIAPLTATIARLLDSLPQSRSAGNGSWFEVADPVRLLPASEGGVDRASLPSRLGFLRLAGEPGSPAALLVFLDPLEPSEVRSLERLARPLTGLVDHARTIHHLSRQASALRALQQVSLIVNATLDTEELLDRVLELLATVVPFDSACVMMGDSRQIRVRAARGYPAFSEVPAAGHALQLEGFANIRRLWKTGRPVLVSNTRSDPEWVVTPLSVHVRSWLGVPIQRRGETIGLFSLDSVTPGFFQSFHVEIVTAFARQVGVALENGELLARERQASQRNRLLQELAGVLNSTPDVQRILDHLAKSAAEALGVSRTGVVLFSPQLDRVVAGAFFDPGQTMPAEAERWWQESIPTMGLPSGWGRQLIQRTRVVSSDLLAALGPRGQALRLVSLLLAPIQRNGTLLGVLALDEPGVERDFGAQDQALATALADHAAVAIHNAQSISELKRHSDELTALFNLGIALSQEITPEGVVDLLFDQVNRLMEVDSAVVARLQSPDSLYCDVLDAGRRLPALSVPLRGPTLSGHVVRTGEPLLINDYDVEVKSLPVPGLTAGIPTRSWLGVPLVVRGEVIGAVSVQAEAPFRFNADHLRLLQMIANHTAVALDNARLLQTASHRAEELRLVNEIGRYAVSVLDIQQLSREVATRILHAFHYYSVQLVLVEDGRLVPQAMVRAPGGEPVQLLRSISLQEATIMTTVANTGKPWLVADVSKEPRYLAVPELPLTRSELAVPLMIAGDVFGVLDVQSDRENGLTSADMELLQILAAQVAISFANARLFAEVRAHAAQLEARVTARTAEIRSQKERTEAILRSVADAVVVLDLDGRLVMTNPVAEGLLAGEHSSDILSQISRLHAQGGVVSEQLEVGSLTFQALASPVTLGELAVGTVIVLRDITRLRELDRLKSQFVATVSHELRTPLANLKLYLSLLRRGRPERREQYLETLDQETARLGEMIEDLLDLSRLESRAEVEKRERVELERLVEEVLENHRPAFQEKSLDLQFSMESRPVVSANRNQLIQVLTNLLSNALRYTPPGGWVRVTLTELQAVEGGRMAALAVQDSGQGIPEEDLPFIFERFYRGTLARNSNTPGSGLGLAIVREILERHAGQVRVTSRLGEGSTFTVLLPLADEGRW
ncbi:MAG: GAF domain-containing protein [Chloroflexota bacterium]